MKLLLMKLAIIAFLAFAISYAWAAYLTLEAIKLTAKGMMK